MLYVSGSGDVESETVLNIIRRRVLEGSTIYTDLFKSYFGLCEAGYIHGAVNHSSGEWVRGNAILMGVRIGHHYSRPWLAIHGAYAGIT